MGGTACGPWRRLGAADERFYWPPYWLPYQPWSAKPWSNKLVLTLETLWAYPSYIFAYGVVRLPVAGTTHPA